MQVEDLTVELETQKSAASNMEKKQKKFDQMLSDEKAVSQRHGISSYLFCHVKLKKIDRNTMHVKYLDCI